MTARAVISPKGEPFLCGIRLNPTACAGKVGLDNDRGLPIVGTESWNRKLAQMVHVLSGEKREENLEKLIICVCWRNTITQHLLELFLIKGA